MPSSDLLPPLYVMTHTTRLLVVGIVIVVVVVGHSCVHISPLKQHHPTFTTTTTPPSSPTHTPPPPSTSILHHSQPHYRHHQYLFLHHPLPSQQSVHLHSHHTTHSTHFQKASTRLFPPGNYRAPVQLYFSKYISCVYFLAWHYTFLWLLLLCSA